MSNYVPSAVLGPENISSAKKDTGWISLENR